ncbi:MAG: succinate dehydrogenase assembly factor 2 [Magnetococcales bacterium]|nr:succinate dehydrogenase assembly factor 2 [Magnetococcales bacterium]MBF0113463.1 succinate dehydrogenase assembly factor 2 [Magnetococcales bacterium]
MANSELLHKQLRWVASRRATAEMEQMLSRFLEQNLAGLTDEQCQRMVSFLDHSDWDILDWLAGKPSPEGVDREPLSWILP